MNILDVNIINDSKKKINVFLEKNEKKFIHRLLSFGAK